MKNLIIVLLSTLMFFTACQKDEDITQVDIQIPDAEQITTTNAYGLVSDENGNTLAETTVRLYNEEGLLLGETITDIQGNFSIEALDAPDSKILVYAEKPDFNSGFIKLDPTPSNMENIHLQLASPDLYPQMAFFDPSTPDQVALNGQVMDNGGNAAEAFILAYVDGELYNVLVTDQDGAYQVIVPSEEIVNIEIYQTCGSSIASLEVGPFTEDQQLEDVVATELNTYTISGVLLNCDGDPVTNGYVLIDWSPSVTSSVAVNNLGQFSLEISDCYTINDQIIFTGYDLSAGTVSDQVTANFDNQDLEAAPINVCTQDDTFVTFQLDGIEYTFEPLIASVVEDSVTNPVSGETTLQEVTTMIYYSVDGQNSFIITITGASNGTYFVSDLLMLIDGQPVSPISSDPAAFAVDGTFTNHENTAGGHVEGSFAGTFVDFTGQRTVTGTFKAIQQ